MNDHPQPQAASPRNPTPKPAAVTDIGRPFLALRHEIERLFDDFDLFDWRPDRRPVRPGFGGPLPSADWPPLHGASPAMDVIEHPDRYEVQAEVPGYDPADLDVRIGEGVLTIRGQTDVTHRHPPATDGDQASPDYHLIERRHGSFQRMLRLPRGIDPDRITARMARGVLTLNLPKSAGAKAQERSIRIDVA